VVAQIRNLPNPDSNLIANFAGEREDSNPKVLIPVFDKDLTNLMGLDIFVYLNQF
jgi:hypothetical protein